jgi:alkylated DNA repair dioxygenase AlkB
LSPYVFGGNIIGERNILDQIQQIHEDWAPAAGPLQPVTAYGIRVYRRGASLGWHTGDRAYVHMF